MDKIQLIKNYREKVGCSLLEARDAINDFIRIASDFGKLHQKWEYKREEGYVGNMPFNQWGDEGWELCATYNNYFYFKRRK